MKLRKILPLVLLVLGALFVLSSCDAMLDAIFQKDAIDVDVAVTGVLAVYNDYYYSWHYPYSTNPQVTCYLSDRSGNPVQTAQAGWSFWDGTYLHFTMSFKNLKDNTFTFSAHYAGSYSPSRNALWPANVYDGNNGVLLSSTPYLTMPYSNASDSTGHFMKVIIVVP